MRQVLEIYLAQLGCQVLTESDGKRALDLLASLPRLPDLILTDLSLPGVDGLEVIRAVHAQSPGHPAILLTGYSADHFMRGQGVQPTAILQKPVRLEELRQTVEKYCKAAPEDQNS
jgi:putative two-component system response regulator